MRGSSGRVRVVPMWRQGRRTCLARSRVLRFGDGFPDFGGEAGDGVAVGWLAVDACVGEGLVEWSGRWVACCGTFAGVDLPAGISVWARARARGGGTLEQTCAISTWKGLGFNQTGSICFSTCFRFGSAVPAGQVPFGVPVVGALRVIHRVVSLAVCFGLSSLPCRACPLASPPDVLRLPVCGGSPVLRRRCASAPFEPVVEYVGTTYPSPQPRLDKLVGERTRPGAVAAWHDLEPGRLSGRRRT